MPGTPGMRPESEARLRELILDEALHTFAEQSVPKERTVEIQ